MKTNIRKISFIEKWWVSLRLFSLPFAVIPFAFGVLLASSIEGHPVDFLITMIAFISVTCFKTASNLLSDIVDYQRGIDKWAHNISGGIIRGWISISEAKKATALLFGVGLISGFVLTMIVGWWVLPFIILAFIISIIYSVGGKFACKFNATGEYCVMFAYGILLPLFSYCITAASFEWWPVILAAPLGFVIAASKHANNWLESNLEGHNQPNINAVRLGNHGSRIYFIGLILLPYLVFLALFFTGYPSGQTDLLAVMLTLISISLPFTLYLVIKAMGKAEALESNRILQLDTLTGALFMLFGALCCIAVYIA